MNKKIAEIEQKKRAREREQIVAKRIKQEQERRAALKSESPLFPAQKSKETDITPVGFWAGFFKLNQYKKALKSYQQELKRYQGKVLSCPKCDYSLVNKDVPEFIKQEVDIIRQGFQDKIKKTINSLREELEGLRIEIQKRDLYIQQLEIDITKYKNDKPV